MRTAPAVAWLLLAVCACTAEPRATDAPDVQEDPHVAVAASPPSPQAAASEPAAPPTAPPQSAVPRPAARDEDLVRAGLEALNRGDGAAAAAALEEALRGGSKSYLVDWNARAGLPLAYVASGDLDRAARRAEELTKDAPADIALGLRHVRADIECARGTVEDATRLYRDVLRSVSDRSKWYEGQNYTVFLEISAKLRLLGRTLPAFEPAWIVGADSFELGDRCAVLTYLSPFVPPYETTATLARLGALPQAPRIAAIVATDADQHVPGPFELPKAMWPKQTQTTKERSAAWRTALGANFPVLGVAPRQVPEDATLFRYDAVVDREHRVVFVSTQSDPDGRIAEAVLRRLAAR